MSRPGQVKAQEGSYTLVGRLRGLPDVDGGEPDTGCSDYFEHPVVASLPEHKLLQVGEVCKSLPCERLLLGRDGRAVEELEGETSGGMGAQVVQGVEDGHSVLHADEAGHFQPGGVGGVAGREERNKHVRAEKTKFILSK